MRLVIATLSIIALLIVGALIGPSFVDWNKYKPEIISQVKNATGMDVSVAGDLSLSVFPIPTVKIEGLSVDAPKKQQFETLLGMKSVEVSVAIMPLLQKKIQVSSVTLIEPDIQIEILKDGTPSWMTDKMAKTQNVKDAIPDEMKEPAQAAKGNAMESIALDNLKIEKGKIAFVNHQTGAKYAATDINVDMEADSLKGPFEFEGNIVFDGKKITIDAETGRLPVKDEPLTLKAELGLPDANALVSFNGVTTIKAPFDVQGQTNIKLDSVSKMAAAFGTNLDAGYNKSLSLDGLLSATENSVIYNDLKFSFGDFVANGKFAVENFKAQNPVRISGVLKSSSTLDLDSLMEKPSSNSSAQNSDAALKSAGKTVAPQKALVPQTLTLPMSMNVDVKIDMAGVKVMKQNMKGVFVDLQKIENTAKVNFKALELAGQSKMDGALNIAYASSSTSPKTGQVVLSDPTVTYEVNGQVGELKNFLSAFAPKADTSAVTNLYKTAQFNLKGAVNKNAISLRDSTMKLDDMVVGLGGQYVPAVGGGRAKATVDIAAGSVDFDRIMAVSGKKPAAAPSAAGTSATGSAPSAKDALKPVKELSLPLDLVFDVSLQKARINQADLDGLRLKGSLIGKKLELINASVNNFAGAAMSAKGEVANLSDLTGIDLTLYTKTADLGQLASALKVDISKLPKGIKSLEANVSGKGGIDNLAFASSIKALGGQLDAMGQATSLLDKPAFSNLTVGLKHPNLVQAIQVVNPEFKGATGLNQAIDFSTKAAMSGKTYTLNDMKVVLGQTNFGGDLKIDTSSKIMAISGDIKAGKIALDSLLGAKQSSGGAASGGGTATSASAKPQGGRWSTAPIDLSFMNTVNVDVNLSASQLTYGKWNFTNPSTDLKIAGGEMKINGMKAGVFGGQANLSTTVKASPVSVALNSSMSGIDLESLVTSLSGSTKLKTAGSVDFNMDVNATGGSANALVNALNGSAKLNGRDVTLKGFDLVKLARGLATEEKLITSAMSLVDGALSGGQTKFDTVRGDYKITNGLVNIESMAMDNPEAIIESTGSADLPKWFINVDNKITLKNVEGLEPFMVKIKGPLDKPTNTFGKNILEDYVGDKLKRKLNKELGDKLPDVLGDDVTNKLKQFGILPQDKTPAPAVVPAPATPAEEGTAPEATPQAAPQPVAPEPKKIEKPADALDSILNSETPEDAVNNVLKGLF